MERPDAARILKAILEQKLFLNEAIGRAGVEQSPFLRQVLATTLRYLGFIDAVLARYLKKAPPKEITHLLRLGVAELLYLKTPDYAAIHEYAEATKTKKLFAYTGLVNAVLRQISRAKTEILAESVSAPLMPEWLQRRWKKNYGPQFDDILKAHLNPPPLDLTFKAGAALPPGEALFESTLRTTESGRIEELSGFNEGTWWVQDVAASFPVKLLGPLKGKRVLDVCAAPGGKTAQLCAAGAEVTALDSSAPRLAILQENMQRLKFQPHLVEADALAYVPAQPFDTVIIDAPCSATGTIRRHPELPWIKDDKVIAEMAPIQTLLLECLDDWLAPGGVAVYCTCSLEPEEGEAQIGRFLQNHPQYRLIPLQAEAYKGKIAPQAFTPEGYLRTLPFYHQGMDGFFAALLQRTA